MDAERSGRMVRALVRSLLKSVLLSGLIIAASVALRLIDARLSNLFLVASSALFMVAAYRREWRLTWLTCLLPAASAALCYVVQVSMLPTRHAGGFLGAGLFFGVIVGWLRGRGHKVLVRDNQLFAKRTLLFLLAWAGCFVLTQGFAMVGYRALIVAGLSGGAFSTAMVAAMSLVLLRKCVSERKALRAAVAAAASPVVVLVAMGLCTRPAPAAAQGVQDPARVGDGFFSRAVFRTRLPSDAEIQAAARRWGEAMGRRDMGLGPADGVWETYPTRYAMQDLAKYHRRDASDPVGSSYVVLLYKREGGVSEFIDAPPGFDGHKGFRDTTVAAFGVAWLVEVSDGQFAFRGVEFPTQARRRGAFDEWRRRFGLVPGFARGAAPGPDPAAPSGERDLWAELQQIRRNLLASGDYSDRATDAGVMAAALLLLSGASIYMASAVAQATAAAAQAGTLSAQGLRPLTPLEREAAGVGMGPITRVGAPPLAGLDDEVFDEGDALGLEAGDADDFPPPQDPAHQLPPYPDDAQSDYIWAVEQLQQLCDEDVQRMIAEGYVVMNPDGSWGALGDVGRRIRGYGRWGADLAGDYLFYQKGDSRDASTRHGRCGEFAEWGMKRAQRYVQEILGDWAVVDQIAIEEGFSFPRDVVGVELFTANHAATRVTLPNGRRLILDYWEGGQQGRITIQSEAEWVRKWRERLEGACPARVLGSFEHHVAVQERTIDNVLRQGGKEGLEKWLGEQIDAISSSRRPAEEKSRDIHRLRTMVQSALRHNGAVVQYLAHDLYSNPPAPAGN